MDVLGVASDTENSKVVHVSRSVGENRREADQCDNARKTDLDNIRDEPV